MEILTFDFGDERELKEFLKRKDIKIKFISTRQGLSGLYCDIFFEIK